MGIRINTRTEPKSNDGGSRRMQAIIVLTLSLCGVLFVWIGEIAQEQTFVDNIETREIGLIKTDAFNESDTNNASPTVDEPVASVSSQSCEDKCKARKDGRNELYGGDILDRTGLLDVIQKQKDELLAKLHTDYGKENFENIFVDKQASGNEQRYKSKYPVSDDGKSVAILKRKFLIKVLTVQASIVKQDSDTTGCDCMHDDSPSSGTTTATNEAAMNATHARYVWATGGHSAAAGHGNLYNESYTAYMERDLKPVFRALGIDFEGRNYAMGGTASGYEVSMCFEQIFGNDIDFFSWDFGMTDGQAFIQLLHYGYRGGLNPGHPAMIGLHIGGRFTGHRVAQLKALEDMGMAVFKGLGSADLEMYEGIPDCTGLSDAEIDAMPEYVRNFKCEGKLESGDPYCGKSKYSKYICARRSKQASWHPGFKAHAIDGHSLALFILQHLIDALKDLSEYEEKDPVKLLETLRKEDEEDHQSFMNADLPGSIKDFYVPKEGEENPGIDNALFFKGPSVCRTARLPAKSRYLGYMTNNGKTGDIAPYTKEAYETGIKESEAKKTASESNEEMRLVYSEDGRERDRSCTSVVLKPDYRDFFYSHVNDGLTKLVFPNEAEKRAYRYDSSAFKGILMIVFAICMHGKCQAGDLRETALEEEKLEMFVNGKPVKSLLDMGHGAIMLVGETGIFWEASANGDYEIAVRAKSEGSYLRLSAFMLY